MQEDGILTVEGDGKDQVLSLDPNNRAMLESAANAIFEFDMYGSLERHEASGNEQTARQGLYLSTNARDVLGYGDSLGANNVVDVAHGPALRYCMLHKLCAAAHLPITEAQLINMLKNDFKKKSYDFPELVKYHLVSLCRYGLIVCDNHEYAGAKNAQEILIKSVSPRAFDFVSVVGQVGKVNVESAPSSIGTYSSDELKLFFEFTRTKRSLRS